MHERMGRRTDRSDLEFAPASTCEAQPHFPSAS